MGLTAHLRVPIPGGLEPRRGDQGAEQVLLVAVERQELGVPLHAQAKKFAGRLDALDDAGAAAPPRRWSRGPWPSRSTDWWCSALTRQRPRPSTALKRLPGSISTSLRGSGVRILGACR